MEVLVSPNDGPQISIEDFDDALADSPFTNDTYTEFDTEFDTVSMCDINANRSHSRLYSENSPEPPTNGVDKMLDRKFACYGISPRLSRKTNYSLSCDFIPIDKDSRPKTLDFPRNEKYNLAVNTDMAESKDGC